MAKKATKKKKPAKYIHCSICGTAVAKTSLVFDSRFAKLRHHYKTKHPEEFKKMVKKGVKTRMKKKK